MSDASKVVIIGSGPAGLTAAIYTARANLKPIVIAGINFGGQLMNTTEVENFPGFPEGIMGPELMQKFVKQAERFGAQLIYENVNKVDFSKDLKEIFTDSNTYTAHSVILAMGAEPKKLGLESEEKYWGRGVSSCATCDGAFYRDKVVAVVGGGDSAAEESNFLTRFASKVYLIVRKGEMRASKIMQDRVLTNKKIEVIWNSEIKEVLGDENKVNALRIFNNKTHDNQDLKVDGLFLAIGHEPSSQFLKGVVDMDDNGYLQTQLRTASNIDGVFVAGDVHDHHYRQAITAAGMGCMAALDAEKWLEFQGL